MRTRSSGSVPSLTVLKTVLKYLYTGNADLLNSTHAEALALLEDEFGIPNSLESDVSFLLETLSLGDLRLMFDDQSHPEYLCHRTIIAARTPFLARILNKKQCENDVMDLHLDSTIIPGKYALVILHAIYMDTLDFRLIGKYLKGHYSLQPLRPCLPFRKWSTNSFRVGSYRRNSVRSLCSRCHELV